jgi:small-conductance mechanosensitive channel
MRAPSTARFTFAAAAICIGALLVPAPAAAVPQQETQTAQDTAQAPAEPTPIAASDIASRSESTNSQLREFRAEVTADPVLDDIGERLPEISAARQELLDDPRNLALERSTMRRLEELRADWLRLGNLLDEAEASLADRSRALEAWRDTLSRLDEVWQVTRETASEQEYAQAAIDRINSTLTEVAEVDAALRDRLDELVTLQTQIAAERTQVTERLAEIEGLLQVAREQLFVRNAPPLWRSIAPPAAERAVASKVSETWAAGVATLRAFARDRDARLLLQLAGFVVLLLLLIALGRRGRYDEDHDALAGYSQILARPASSALLVAILASLAIHPDAPPVALELVALIGVLPLLRLLPRLVHPSLRRSVYRLGALVVLHRLNSLLLIDTVVERVVMLIVTVLALGGLIWGLRSSSAAGAHARGWLGRIARLAAGLAVPTLATSAVANALGYVVLAGLLTNGTLMSLYVAAVVFTAASVLDGVATLSLRTRAARRLNSVRKHRELLDRRIGALIHFVAFFAWAEPTLELFQLRDGLIDFFRVALSQRLTVGELSVTIGGILAFVLAITLTVLLSRFIRFALAEDVFPRLKLPRGVGDSISMVIHYLVIGFGIFVALAAAGLEWRSFALVAGALSIGIGFGMQNLVNNFVSGLILIFERPIQLGDTVEFGDRLGVVRRIGIRSSTVSTFDGAEVIVPNGNLISAEVVNWTLTDRTRRLEVSVGVAYGTDPHRVIEILLEVVNQHDDVLQRPAPVGFFDGFGECSLDFSVWLWTTSLEWRRVRSEASLKIHDALRDAGIEIPFPQRDLHVRSIDEAVIRETRRGEGERDAKS